MAMLISRRSMVLGATLALPVLGVVGASDLPMLARLIQHPTRHRVSLIHLGWVAWALWNVVAFWWWEFRLRLIAHWNFGLYFFVCFYASIYYFLSALLFPDDIEGYDGYEDYFLSRRAWFFGFAALSEALDVVDTWIKGAEHLRSIGPEYFVQIGIFLVLCAVAANTRNLTFHAVFVFVAFVYEAAGFLIGFYDVS